MKIILASAAILLAAIPTSEPSVVGNFKERMATCKPYGNCRACSSCRYCAHCAKNGGSCSVCRLGHDK